MIQDNIGKVHGVNVSYKKTWITKNILLELSLGNFEKLYELLPIYGKELVRSNPLIIFKVIVDQDVYPLNRKDFLKSFLSI